MLLLVALLLLVLYKGVVAPYRTYQFYRKTIARDYCLLPYPFALFGKVFYDTISNDL